MAICSRLSGVKRIRTLAPDLRIRCAVIFNLLQIGGMVRSRLSHTALFTRRHDVVLKNQDESPFYDPASAQVISNYNISDE
jgi:hypothetical protein